MQKIDLFSRPDLSLFFESRREDIIRYIKALPDKHFGNDQLEEETKKIRKEYLVRMPELDFGNRKRTESADARGTRMEIPYSGSADLLAYSPSQTSDHQLTDYFDDDEEMLLIKEIPLSTENITAYFDEQLALIQKKHKELSTIVWEETDNLSDLIDSEIKKRSRKIRDNRDFLDGLAS
ncbi:hypothetical protein [Dyadobacter helix]|nr:hypothetical protein [Dyadobacter sp. CECT 9275]